MTKSKKTIKIERADDVLNYSYGSENKIDLILETPLYSDSTPGLFSSNVQLGNKSGPYIYNVVIFHNGKYEYSVTALSDINVLSEETFTGVRVNSPSQKTIEIKCINETIQDRFESIYSYNRSRKK
jgi:hypothetical protein